MQESNPVKSEGKTRWAHYQIAYHFVWIPKYRRHVLTGQVEKETKRLIHECAKRFGFQILALETDSDHVHCFVSAAPRFSPAKLANLLSHFLNAPSQNFQNS